MAKENAQDLDDLPAANPGENGASRDQGHRVSELLTEWDSHVGRIADSVGAMCRQREKGCRKIFCDVSGVEIRNFRVSLVRTASFCLLHECFFFFVVLG